MMRSFLLLLFCLLLNVFSIQSLQNPENSLTLNEAYTWNLNTNITWDYYFGLGISIYEDLIGVLAAFSPHPLYLYRNNGTMFVENGTVSLSGLPYSESVSIYGNVFVASDRLFDGRAVQIYRFNGANWNFEQRIENSSLISFGYRLALYQDCLVFSAYNSAPLFVYRFNGSLWNSEQNLTQVIGSSIVDSLSMYENVIVAGSKDGPKAYVYRFNGTYWNNEKNFTGSYGSKFGISVSVYGDLIAVGTNASKVFVYRFDGSNWNTEQTITGTANSGFGMTVAIYETLLVVASSYSQQVFFYRYNGSYWNIEQILNGLPVQTSELNYRIAISGNFTVFGFPDSAQVHVYEATISQVNVVNCSSLFSSFECYWNQLQDSNLKYQINYGFDWIDIESPILEDGELYFQEFNGSIYANITGNENYSIQIRACNPSSNICGQASSPIIDLKTRIDSIKNFEYSIPTLNSINLTWSYPDVMIDEEIPHLDHYNFSYFPQTEPESISSIMLDNSSTSYLINDSQCGLIENISIFACRTPECDGEDQGEIFESSISIPFQEVENLQCSISYSLDINCTWDPPTGCTTPSYYNLSYQSTPEDDSGNYQPTSTNQIVKAQFPNQEYQINVSACDSNNKCGNSSSFSISTDALPLAPAINEIIPKIEEIELNFTKVSKANNYSILIDNGSNWQNFTTLDLSGDNAIGIISGIEGNIEKNISVRGCADLNCETQYLGEPTSLYSTKAKLGNVPSLNCSSLPFGFICTWDQLIFSTGVEAFSFSYNSTSICLTNLSTNYSASYLPPQEYYEISVYASADSNCSFNQYSGIESNTSVSTNNLTAPTINEIIPKIEEIELNFTKVSRANNYSILIDNGSNWQNFTTLDLSGDNAIGTISGIEGNIEKNISIRGCADLNCETQYLGEPTSLYSTKAKLGNVPSLNCYSTAYGFVCTWNLLFFSTGVEAYSFRYNIYSVCLPKSSNYYSVSGLESGVQFNIEIYASADPNCYFDEYSGMLSTSQIETLSPTQTSDNSSKTPIIVMAVVLPVVVIAAVVIIIVLVQKQKKSIKSIIKKKQKELESTGGIEMI